MAAKTIEAAQSEESSMPVDGADEDTNLMQVDSDGSQNGDGTFIATMDDDDEDHELDLPRVRAAPPQPAKSKKKTSLRTEVQEASGTAQDTSTLGMSDKRKGTHDDSNV